MGGILPAPPQRVETGRASAARTPRANLPGQARLSSAEHHLLIDWLDHLAAEPEEKSDASRGSH
jgi:hypothetical protein